MGQIDMGGDFGFDAIDRAAIGQVLAKLKEWEALTWRELFHGDLHGHHEVETDRLVRAAQKRLTEIDLDDLDALLSLRVTGKHRAWGFLDPHGVVHLLWWDPEHQVCPSTKKGT